MSLLGTTAVVQVTSIVRAFDKVRRLDIRGALLELRGPTRFDQQKHYRAKDAPDGHWPGLAASTLERRTRKRGRDKRGRNRSWPKELLGRFPTALKSKVTSNELVVSSTVKRFSMTHQAGGRAGHGARIPRRQYLWISKWLLAQAVKTFQKKLNSAANGTP